MIKSITIDYNVVTGDISISYSDDFHALEAFGILEGAKQMVAHKWFEEEDDRVGS